MKLHKIILLLITILLFTGCSKTTGNNSDDIEDNTDSIVISDPDVIEHINPPEPTDVPNITPEAEPDDEISFVYPVVSLDNENYTYNYFNYVNKLPIIKISDYVYEFSYDGIVTLTDLRNGSGISFHIMDKVDMSGYLGASASADDWYYIGHLLTDDSAFIRYDYIGDVEYSFLLRMDLSCETIDICAAADYQDKEGMNNFIVYSDVVYYTKVQEAGNGFEVMLVGLSLSDGTERVVFTFDKNIEIHNVFPYGDSLYMICINAYGTKKLCRYDIAGDRFDVLLKECVSDFLYVYDDCVMLSIQNDTSLCYYNISNKKYYYLRLNSGSNNYFSSLFLSGEGVYIAVFSWDEDSETRLARLDLKNKSIDKYVQLSKAFYRCLGIMDEIVYAEDGGEYKGFSLVTGAEVRVLAD